MKKIIRQTDTFELYQRTGQFWIRCKRKEHHPRSVRISETDADYLQECSTTTNKPANISTFDMACGGILDVEPADNL